MSFNFEMVPLPILALKCGLGIWAAGALLVFFKANKGKDRFYSTLLFAGGLLVGLSALLSYGQTAATYNFLPYCYFGVAPFTVRIDGLVCFFLGIISLTVCALAIF